MWRCRGSPERPPGEMRTRASSLAAPTRRTVWTYPTMNRASGTHGAPILPRGPGCAFQEGWRNTEHRSVKCSVTVSYGDLDRSPGRASYATLRLGSRHRSQRSWERTCSFNPPLCSRRSGALVSSCQQTGPALALIDPLRQGLRATGLLPAGVSRRREADEIAGVRWYGAMQQTMRGMMPILSVMKVGRDRPQLCARESTDKLTTAPLAVGAATAFQAASAETHRQPSWRWLPARVAPL